VTTVLVAEPVLPGVAVVVLVVVMTCLLSNSPRCK
jgi:hypothetical protein